MTDYRLDVAGMADETDLSAVLSASYSVLLKNDYADDVLAVALPGMIRANPVLVRSGRFYIVRTSDGHTAGCGGWSYERPGSGRQNGGELEDGVAHIRHFAVHPGHLKRGVGRLLLEACIENATGATAFECYSTLSAEPFYAAIGFRKVRPFLVDMGQGVQFPSVLMRKTIGAPAE